MVLAYNIRVRPFSSFALHTEQPQNHRRRWKQTRKSSHPFQETTYHHQHYYYHNVGENLSSFSCSKLYQSPFQIRIDTIPRELVLGWKILFSAPSQPITNKQQFPYSCCRKQLTEPVAFRGQMLICGSKVGTLLLQPGKRKRGRQ